MQFSPSKIWTIDRLHIQREIHNSIIMTIDPSGEDGTAAAEKKPKVFCDDKHRNGHINLGLNIFGFSKSEKINQQTNARNPDLRPQPKNNQRGNESFHIQAHLVETFLLFVLSVLFIDLFVRRGYLKNLAITGYNFSKASGLSHRNVNIS